MKYLILLLLVIGCSSSNQWIEESEKVREISYEKMGRKFDLSWEEYYFLLGHGVSRPQAEEIMQRWTEQQWIDRRDGIIKILSE